MPFEKRQILFDYAEFQKLLSKSPLSGTYPGDYRQPSIREVVRTADERGGINSRANDLMRRLDTQITEPSIIIRFSHSSMLKSEKEGLISFPEERIIEVLVRECQRTSIRLPKHPTKFLVAEELTIGLSMKFVVK
jgi:hypothetical protein